MEDSRQVSDAPAALPDCSQSPIHTDKYNFFDRPALSWSDDEEPTHPIRRCRYCAGSGTLRPWPPCVRKRRASDSAELAANQADPGVGRVAVRSLVGHVDHPVLTGVDTLRHGERSGAVVEGSE